MNMNYKQWRSNGHSKAAHEVMAESIGKFQNTLSDSLDTGNPKTASLEQFCFRPWGKRATKARFQGLVESNCFNDVLNAMGTTFANEIVKTAWDKPRRDVAAMLLLVGWLPKESRGKLSFTPNKKSFKDMEYSSELASCYLAGFNAGLDPAEIRFANLEFSQEWRLFFDNAIRAKQGRETEPQEASMHDATIIEGEFSRVVEPVAALPVLKRDFTFSEPMVFTVGLLDTMVNPVEFPIIETDTDMEIRKEMEALKREARNAKRRESRKAKKQAA